MPPNKKGGKNYKKGKHVDDEPIVYERLEGQMFGRVLKLLGGCNALVYCNDNRERLCHIRGNMRKKVWLVPGDIVLISLRELDTSGNTPTSKIDKGDICAKYDQKVIYKLREKDKTINEKLFTIIEKNDTGGKNSNGIPDDGDGFVFEGREEYDEDDSESEDENKPSNRTAQKRAMMMADDDIDIDDI
jgi:translation initiation factor 1A